VSGRGTLVASAVNGRAGSHTYLSDERLCGGFVVLRRVVGAIVTVGDAGGGTPPLPPASCPCWQRAAANGTCPGLQVW
jgi:hypothetical protein